MSTKLVNELNEMIIKLTAMRDNLDPSQSSNRAAMFSGNVGQTPVREFPKNEVLESNLATKPQTWEDHTTSFVQATIRHIESGSQYTLPSQHTLRAEGILPLLIKVGEAIEDLVDNGHVITKIIMEPHSGLKEPPKDNNTGDVQ